MPARRPPPYPPPRPPVPPQILADLRDLRNTPRPLDGWFGLFGVVALSAGLVGLPEMIVHQAMFRHGTIRGGDWLTLGGVEAGLTCALLGLIAKRRAHRRLRRYFAERKSYGDEK